MMASTTLRWFLYVDEMNYRNLQTRKRKTQRCICYRDSDCPQQSRICKTKKSLFLLPMQLVSYPLNNPTSGCKALTIAQLFNKPSDRDLSLTLTEGKELMVNKLCLELSHSSLMAWSSFTVLMPTALGTIYFTWTNL